MKKKLKLFFKNLFLNTSIYYYDYIPVKEILGTYDFNDGRNKKLPDSKVEALLKKYKEVGFDETFYIEVYPLIDTPFKVDDKIHWPSKGQLPIAEVEGEIKMLPQYKYRSTDGNHRLCAAKHFYGQDYEILAIVVHNMGWKWEMQHIHKLCNILIYINILFLILLLLT
jgi:hypothetical protein